MRKNAPSTVKRLTRSVIAVIVLSICLVISSVALVLATVSFPGHLFHTGTVDINLNDGEPVIDEYEFLFEPGMRVQKSFFLENDSSTAVYYKLYFDQVSGGLADVLEITISDAETGQVLYVGTANALSQAKVTAADDELAIGERRDLDITFYYPEEAGNASQGQELTFALCATAVQTKNNENRSF